MSAARHALSSAEDLPAGGAICRLRENAGFVKNDTVVGCNNHAELWDSEAWDAVFRQETTPENIAAVMEELEF